MPVRDQSLVVEAITAARHDLPFAMRGVDTDNDSAFMNETVFDYCKTNGWSRRAHAPTRRTIRRGWSRRTAPSCGTSWAMAASAGWPPRAPWPSCMPSSRLYVNFFQPSFKLKSKTREGAHVSKTYYPPATPCYRLLASSGVSEEVKAKLRDQFNGLDPVRLLHDIRAAQQVLSDMMQAPQEVDASTSKTSGISAFLEGLATAWKDGEVRPTHRRKTTAQRWWRTREDPFELAWPVVEGWLISQPTVTAKELMNRLARAAPDAYASKAQLRTLQRRIKAWRAEKAKDLVLGQLRKVVEQAA